MTFSVVLRVHIEGDRGNGNYTGNSDVNKSVSSKQAYRNALYHAFNQYYYDFFDESNLTGSQGNPYEDYNITHYHVYDYKAHYYRKINGKVREVKSRSKTPIKSKRAVYYQFRKEAKMRKVQKARNRTYTIGTKGTKKAKPVRNVKKKQSSDSSYTIGSKD